MRILGFQMPRSSYFNIHKLSAITAMPTTTPTMDRCSSPKERETGGR
jgi:hypothetical protein